LAINEADGKLLWQRDLLPYKDCRQMVPAVLVGHIWTPSIDGDCLPASLSPRVTSGLLREYFNFDGLVMTDDLLMKAVTDKYGIGEAAVLAILAGVDQVLICGTLEQSLEAHKHISEAVDSGRISEKRIEESVRRIEKALAATSAAGKRNSEELQTAMDKLRAEIAVDSDTALGASAAAITVLRGVIPDEFDGEWVVVAPDHPRYPMKLSARLKETFGKGKFKDVEVLEKRY